MLRFKRYPISFAAALAGALTISMGCSSDPAPEATRSEELASEEDAACVSATIGDGSTCIDYADLKMQIYTQCEADGKVLVDISNSIECPNGGGVGQADYTCCAPAPPSEDPPNQEPPTPGGCVAEMLGDGMTCSPHADLEAQAIALCDSHSLPMVSFGVANDCADAGESSYGKVACCLEAAPSDPPPICSHHALGDGTTCADDEAWAAEAEAICAAEGRPVSAIGLAFDCADGTSSYGKLACCDP